MGFHFTKIAHPFGCAYFALLVIRLGFGKIAHFLVEWSILLGVIMLYNVLIIKYISCFDLNVL